MLERLQRLNKLVVNGWDDANADDQVKSPSECTGAGPADGASARSPASCRAPPSTGDRDKDCVHRDRGGQAARRRWRRRSSSPDGDADPSCDDDGAARRAATMTTSATGITETGLGEGCAVTRTARFGLAGAALVVGASRYLLRAPAPDDYDAIGFVAAVRDFDPARLQPQAPGYPVYVGLARLADRLVLDDPLRAAELVSAIAGAATAIAAFALARRVAARTDAPTESADRAGWIALSRRRRGAAVGAGRRGAERRVRDGPRRLVLRSRARRHAALRPRGSPLRAYARDAPLVRAALLPGLAILLAARAPRPSRALARFALGLIAGVVAWAVRLVPSSVGASSPRSHSRTAPATSRCGAARSPRTPIRRRASTPSFAACSTTASRPTARRSRSSARCSSGRPCWSAREADGRRAPGPRPARRSASPPPSPPTRCGCCSDRT